MRALWTRPWLVAMAPVSFLVYTVPMGTFQLRPLIILLALAAAAAYWFAVFPKTTWSQVLYLTLIAIPLVFKIFPLLYPRAADIRLDILGHLIWIRVSVITLLRDIQPEGVNFGFWPNRREWLAGLTGFLLLIPAVFPVAYLLGAATYTTPPWTWQETALRAAGTFFGILWVTALSEQFYFRGFLDRWLTPIGSAVVFGLVHLPYRGFPNYGFAAAAAVTGYFYYLAFRRGQGLRAAMVAHALTVMVFKTLFR